jgi:hypothetical protein
VIGANAFVRSKVSSVRFESNPELREIGSEAFLGGHELTAFSIPGSVEIVGDRCFVSCFDLKTIEFEGQSWLRRIGERAFVGGKLNSIAIPALTEEIDESASVTCPLMEIRVEGHLVFNVEGNLLVTSNGTEIVRYFGLDRENSLNFTEIHSD